jgi:uncharacterized protein YbjT (DUF2867 family)
VTITPPAPATSGLLEQRLRDTSSSPHMTTLVTGASGFVGSLLVPRLLEDGRRVRALGRNPDRVRETLEQYLDIEAEDLEVLRGDAFKGEGLDVALDGVEVAYYLIHSMERSGPGSAAFSDRDRLAARNFAAAAARAGTRRVIYLGGLVPRWARRVTDGRPQMSGLDGPPVSGLEAARLSRHLASREEVEHILLDAVPDSVALRASIIIGPRSRSFRLLVRLVERMPVLTLPSWRRFRTAPIDQRDAIAMLAACAEAPVGGRSLEIGGPDALTYEEIMRRIAELLLVGRPAVGLGVSMTPIAARLTAAIVGEDPELVLPLMEGLTGDLLPTGEDAAALLGVQLHSFDAAVERALCEWEEHERLAAR